MEKRLHTENKVMDHLIKTYIADIAKKKGEMWATLVYMLATGKVLAKEFEPKLSEEENHKLVMLLFNTVAAANYTDQLPALTKDADKFLDKLIEQLQLLEEWQKC